MYVPLRVHGWHSLLTGVDPPETLLRRAGGLGLPALALTDVDSLCGLVEFLQAARERPGEGSREASVGHRDGRGAPGGLPRPIIGAELSDPSGRPGRLVALVRTAEGYRNLCKLVSSRMLGGDPGDPDETGAELEGPEAFDLVEAAERYAEGLVLLVDHPRLAFALAERVPREDLLVAVSPAGLQRAGRFAGARRTRRALRLAWDADGADERPPTSDSPKVPPPARAVAAADLVATARTLGLATLAVPDVYCAYPEGWEHHRVRTAIKTNALLCDLPESWVAERPAHLLSPVEMGVLYRDLPEASGPYGSARRSGGALENGMLARTLEVAERCTFLPELGGVLFPEVELEDAETAYSRLFALSFEGARRRYRPLRPEVVRRLDYELSAIEGLGYAPYFLLVRKIADFARERGIPHVGRGSAADSLVAYCLELTDADPLRYDLPFERFLNPARRDRPDIDLDFCWRRRDEVIEHVWEAFGAERTAMISTLNRFGLRAAFREAALAEGIPPVEVNRWSRRLPWMVAGAGSQGAFDGVGDDGGESEGEEDGAGGSAEGGELEGFPTPTETAAAAPGPSPGFPGRVGARDGRPDGTGGAPLPLPPHLTDNPVALALAATPECRRFPIEDERFDRVLRIAAALIDAPRHLGLHPGGVVVAPGSITDVVACQRAAKGVIVTQPDKDGVEALGLVKMDLLGNRALTVVDDCLASLREAGIEVDPTAAPEDDARTARLLAHGATLGCFQIESPGMRNLLKQIAARTMDDVIQAVALIRPGPAGSGMKDAYVRRFRGLEEPHAPHPRLTQLLWDTQGVMLYQEDVMQTVACMAGMDLAEADELRRALGKRRHQALARLQARFFEGCAAEGIEREGAEHVWELVHNFASFGFCKAHAVTYGRIAYRTAWLKAHHPAAFLTAFLNSHTGYYEARVYVEEARRLGVAILPPDVNRSRAGFALEELDPAAPGPHEEPRGAPSPRFGLRIGLERVKGLTERTLGTLLEERGRRGAFLSLPDFLARTRARVDETERLIQCGAFDAFDRTRPEMLWRLHLLHAPSRRAPRGEGLDPDQLAACRTSPDDRAHAARQATGGWTSRGGLGLGALRLEAGESTSLFPEPETPALALPRLPELDRATRGRLELELLALNVTDHPTRLFPAPSAENAPTVIRCDELEAHRGKRVSLCGWLAASRRVRTADDRWMRFLTLEDVYGIAEAVLFPDVYERDGQRLVDRGPFLISGIVEDQMGACNLHAERIW